MPSRSEPEHLVELPNRTRRPAFFRLEVRPSSVHGVGVFACERIPAGARIAPYVGGKDMTYSEFKERYTRNGKTDWRYVYRRPPWLPQTVNKAWRSRNISNFTNDGRHGQKRNRVNVAHKSGHLISTREIRAGQELFLDYGDAYWEGHP